VVGNETNESIYGSVHFLSHFILKQKSIITSP